MKPIVVVEMPRAGLGNLLYIWSKAVIFSYKNNLPLYINGWSKLRLGPYIRREKSKRRYGRYFKKRTKWFKLCIYRIFNKRKILIEPDLNGSVRLYPGIDIFLYKEIPHISDGDIFKPLEPYKQLILSTFFGMLRENVARQISNLHNPEIGMHIRRSDFRVLQLTTPDEYFINSMNEIRRKYGSNLQVSVFSDGYEDELQGVLSIPHTCLVHNDSDLLDLIQLSRSRFIITSPKSTFSMWAKFLGNAEVVICSLLFLIVNLTLDHAII